MPVALFCGSRCTQSSVILELLLGMIAKRFPTVVMRSNNKFWDKSAELETRWSDLCLPFNRYLQTLKNNAVNVSNLLTDLFVEICVWRSVCDRATQEKWTTKWTFWILLEFVGTGRSWISEIWGIWPFAAKLTPILWMGGLYCALLT